MRADSALGRALDGAIPIGDLMLAVHAAIAAAPRRDRGMRWLAPRDAVGCTLLTDVYAPGDLPPCATAVMDGYALSGSGPGSYPVAGRGARAPFAIAVEAGDPLPSDAVAVVRERPEGDGTIRLTRWIQSPNVRRQGEDAKAGDRLVAAGRRLTLADACLLAAAGVAQLPVTPPPTLLIIADAVCAPAVLLGLGETAAIHRTVNTENVPGTLAEVDLIIRAEQAFRAPASAGSVAVFTPNARPAKPVAVGPGVPGGPPVLGLAGSPFAIALAARLHGRAALAALVGQPAQTAPAGLPQAPASFAHPGDARRDLLLPMRFETADHAAVIGLCGPIGHITAFARSDGAVLIPAGSGPVSPGRLLSVLVW